MKGAAADPHKDRAEAESALAREHVHDWWTSTAKSRIHPGAGVIICHTIKGKGVSFTERNLSWHHKSKVSEAEVASLAFLFVQLAPWQRSIW